MIIHVRNAGDPPTQTYKTKKVDLICQKPGSNFKTSCLYDKAVISAMEMLVFIKQTHRYSEMIRNASRMYGDIHDPLGLTYPGPCNL